MCERESRRGSYVCTYECVFYCVLALWWFHLKTLWLQCDTEVTGQSRSKIPIHLACSVFFLSRKGEINSSPQLSRTPASFTARKPHVTARRRQQMGGESKGEIQQGSAGMKDREREAERSLKATLLHE